MPRILLGEQYREDHANDRWRKRALCRRMVETGEMSAYEMGELMHPTRESTPAEIQRARDVCAVCPVREQCLDFALYSVEKQGVWGGQTYAERKIELRSRALIGRRIKLAAS